MTRYYGDPIDLPWCRILDQYKRIPAVEREFKPKSPEEIAAAMAEAQIEDEKRQDAEDRGIDVDNPLYDPHVEV